MPSCVLQLAALLLRVAASPPATEPPSPPATEGRDVLTDGFGTFGARWHVVFHLVDDWSFNSWLPALNTWCTPTPCTFPSARAAHGGTLTPRTFHAVHC